MPTAVHALLPQLVELALQARRLGRDDERQRLAIRQVAPAVAVAIDVAEPVEQRLGGGDVEAHEVLARRVEAEHVRRQELRRHLGLTLPDHPGLLVGVVRHADRAPQRDLLLRVAADDGVLHVEVREADRGTQSPRERDALLGIPGLKLPVAVENVQGHFLKIQVVEVPLFEGEQAGVGLLENADLHASDRRQLLAAHLSDDGPVGRIVAVGKGLVAKSGVRLQRDLLPAPPLLEQVRPRAHGIGHHPAARDRRTPRPPPARPPTSPRR